MGTRALRSPEYWGTKVGKWRKKESYSALTRHLENYPKGYKQWDCFVFSDYVQRAAAARTYEVRHLPLSDGNDKKHFGDSFKFDWAKHAWTPAKTKATAEILVKREPTIPHSGNANNDVPMIVDVETGELIAIE